MAVGALRRNNGTRIGQLTPGASSDKSDASSARVVGGTARGNLNTFALNRAPGESSVAYANAAVIVVVRALGGDGLTAVSQRTPGITRDKGQTSSAAVVSGTASGNLDA